MEHCSVCVCGRGIKQRHAEEGNLQAALGPIAIFFRVSGAGAACCIHLSVSVCVDRHQDQVELQKHIWNFGPKVQSQEVALLFIAE